jgi:opacity protein-like surface antigen
LQAQAVGAVQYVDYLEGYFGNEFRGQLTGLLNWTISPQRLNFVAQDYSSVEPVSIRAADSPANQQQVNVFVAGPSLSFLLGAQSGWTGQADLRYINTTASKTKDFESQRGMGALRLLHDLNVSDHLSFNFETEGVHFDDIQAATTDGYTKYNLYARYFSNLPKIDMDFSLGGSRIDFTRGFGGHSGALVNASISWRIDPRNTLQFAGSDQLTDATSDLAQAPDLAAAQLTSPAFAIGRTAISPAVFRNRNVSLDYVFREGRFGFTLAPYYARLRQINGDDLSRNDYGVIAGASYQLSPLMTLGVTLGHRNGEYLVDHSTDRDNMATIDLSRELTQHWTWSVAFSHDQRRSTVPGNSYTENEVFAFLYYRR